MGFTETGVRNLIRYQPTGTYYARVRVGSALKRKSLKTTVLSVAKLRLRDFEDGVRSAAETQRATFTGNLLVGDAAAILLDRINSDPALKPASKEYYRQRFDALKRSWPELVFKDVRAVARHECVGWASRFSKATSASAFNNTLSLLRRSFDVAIEHGLRYDNPASDLKRAKVMAKRLVLPEPDQFRDYVQTIRTAGGRDSENCADLVEFLAYGGFRISEAGQIRWRDCSFHKNEIVVRGDPVTGTKNWTVRRVPMIPDMLSLLKRLREQRPEVSPEDFVMLVKKCKLAMKRAASIMDIHHLSHHDLRHLFATRCIESGVDIPTVSRWLGHKDGGALAMKTYGHLRNEHSLAMAEKVRFGVRETET